MQDRKRRGLLSGVAEWAREGVNWYDKMGKDFKGWSCTSMKLYAFVDRCGGVDVRIGYS